MLDTIFLVAGFSTDTGHQSGEGDGSWGGPHNDVSRLLQHDILLHSSTTFPEERNYRLWFPRHAHVGCSR